MSEIFYAQGLKFTCQRCSSCCRYDAGFVYLSEKDIESLIVKLEIDREKLIGLYCRWVDSWNGSKVLSLKEKANKDCVFWETAKGCIVYEARPLQCRTFPFWENIVSSKSNWKIAASGCQGINKGELHTREEIDLLLEMSSSCSYIKRGD